MNGRREFLVNTMKTIDIAVMLVSLLVATFFTYSSLQHISLGDFLGMRVKVQNAVLLVIWVTGWSLLLARFRAYDAQRLASASASADLGLLRATTLGAAMLLLTDWIVPIEILTFRSLLAFWVMVSFATIGVRVLLRLLLGALGRDRRGWDHLVIVGTNRRAIEFANRVRKVPGLGYRLVGFVDDAWSGLPEFEASGYRVATDFDGFADFLNANVVDDVVVCLPVRSLYERALRLIAQCEEQGIRVRFDPDLFPSARHRVDREADDEDRLVTVLSNDSMEGPAAVVKRLIDLSLASLALLVLSPVLVAIAIAIRLDSPGPVFFSQERMGLNKRRFRLFKFRTMVVDAEKRLAELEDKNEVSGPVFKIRNDPRITRIGAFLRRTSLDELPQLLNVVLGEMSLVGPRPLPVRDYQGFSKDWHRRRFSVLPGITCLWQVLGRSSIPFERWMELDMQYIDQWSLGLDLKILVRTLPAILKGSGAS
jgi:exopolysaccharide biosynthesis polyprenyl glycosylphosphotransferase